jgi:hypothetical protein
MTTKNGLPDYLHALPEARRRVFAQLDSVVRPLAADIPDSLASFVFLPDQQDHVRWEDADDVFWQATEELYLKERPRDGELPLFYWGFHSYDLLVRRSANGVLVTDTAVYLRDVAGRRTVLPIAGLPENPLDAGSGQLRCGEAVIDVSQAARLFAPGDLPASAELLNRVVERVRADAPADTVPAAATVATRIQASTLSDDFLLPDRQKDLKRIAKLRSKWQLPTEEALLFAWSSATLMGVYGLAVTEAAVYSKDLLDPLERTPRAELVPSQLAWDAGEKVFTLGAQKIPTLPSATEDNREYLLALLRDLLALER